MTCYIPLPKIRLLNADNRPWGGSQQLVQGRLFFMIGKEIFVEKKSAADQIKEITAGIEKGIMELFESDNYRRYLSTMSKFHHYSFNNTMLIHLQKPDATLVAGFNKWEKVFERRVKKGSRGIRIFAPTPYLKKIQAQKIDPDTHLPVLDAQGKPVTEEKTVKVPYFKVVSVFDVSQTYGKPIPQIVNPLEGNVERYDILMEALRRVSPVPFEIAPMEPGMEGYFSPGQQEIVIREGMSQVQTVCAAVHEISHAALHDYEHMTELADDGETLLVPGAKDRGTEEVEAESISYAVCQYFGIETSGNSFGYIAEWSSGKELAELRASLETINKTASALITQLEQQVALICQERTVAPAELAGELPSESDKPLTFEDMEALAAEIDQLFLSADTFSYMQEEPDRGIACENILLSIGNNGLEEMLSSVEDLAEYAPPEDMPKVQALLEKLHGLEQKELPPIIRPDGDLETLFLLDNGDYLHIQEADTGFDYTVYDSTVLDISEEGSLPRALLPMSEAPGLICPELNSPASPMRKLPVELVKLLQEMQSELNADGYDADREAQLFAGRFAVYTASRMGDTPVAELSSCNAAYLRDWALAHLRERDFRPISDVLLDVAAAHGQDHAFDYLTDILADINMESHSLTPTLSGAASLESDSHPEPQIREPIAAAQVYDNTVPDPLVSQEFMHNYGYTYEGMLPLSVDRAKELMSFDVTLYQLYGDGTEAMVLDELDIVRHDGLFGISREDWEEIQLQVPVRDVEKRFLDSTGDAFAIYQLRPDAPAELTGARFSKLEQPPSRENYQAVYVNGLNPGDDVQTNLYNIVDIFTRDMPQDFTGHENDVGDIIALKQDGVVTYHYCDYIGFKELPDFGKPHNYLKSAEMSTEDDYGMIDGIINNGTKPTVAELEQQAKAGAPISLIVLADAIQREKKQSVLEQLKPTPKPPAKGKRSKKSEREM